MASPMSSFVPAPLSPSPSLSYLPAAGGYVPAAVPLSPQPVTRLGSFGSYAGTGTVGVLPAAPVPRPLPLAANGSMPSEPPSLTIDMPDPSAISRQKDNYMKMLDQQLQQSITVLDQRVKYQRDALGVQADQQRKQLIMQLEQNVKAQEMALSQQYSEQLMALQLQNSSQKAALEQQAMQLSVNYEQRKAEEDLYRQQYDMHMKQAAMAERLREEQQRALTPLVPEPIAAASTALEEPAASAAAAPTVISSVQTAPPIVLPSSTAITQSVSNLSGTLTPQPAYSRSVSPLPVYAPSYISSAAAAAPAPYYHSMPGVIR